VRIGDPRDKSAEQKAEARERAEARDTSTKDTGRRPVARVAKGTGREGTGREGTGREGTGREGTGREGTGRISARPPASTPPRPTNRRVPREGAADTSPRGTDSNVGGLDPHEYPTLTAVGRDLTALARAGAIDPVIGREAELEQLLDVLSRRRANNPLLVGPPGVGKTSLAHALAIALAAGKAPGLEGKILLEVSAGALVSGTSVRGALAERVRRLQSEVTKAGKNVLLFLDDVHAVLGAGDGADDVATELKAALARGDFPCIGATTEADARRHFDRDPALARRFSPVPVNEPSPAASKVILRGLIPSYEAHHHVRYEPDAIDAAVDLTVRYVTEKHLPDKALSVLDLAAARARRAGAKVVDVDAVARVVASEAHVPLERLRIKDGERMLSAGALLAERVVGTASAARAHRATCCAQRRGAARAPADRLVPAARAPRAWARPRRPRPSPRRSSTRETR
jgi:ATP-dependent Clp protease ATP-binding subunit ClpC